MGTMKTEMEKAGFKLSPEGEQKVKESLNVMKKKLKTSLCRKCGEPIKFVKVDSRTIPYDLDDVPHWQTCASSSFTQKKAAFDIMKKLAVLFIVKHGINLEEEAGLTKKETQVIQSVLERAFKEDNKETAAKIVADKDDGKVSGDIPFEPEPCDSIGDPDEDRAVSEELIHEVEEKILTEPTLDKGVETVIGEPITDTPLPENTIVGNLE